MYINGYVCIHVYVYVYVHTYTYTDTHVYVERWGMHRFLYKGEACICVCEYEVQIEYYVQLQTYVIYSRLQIRMAQNLQNISENFQFSTRRTRVLMEFIMSTIYHVVLIVYPMGRILVC